MANANNKILLIDDDSTFIDIYTKTFQEAGFDFSVALNGIEALDKVKREKPAIVLLDIMMPGIDGFEILKRIKKDPETAKTTVWMITNLAEEMNRQIASSMGAADYLIKSQHTPRQVCDKIRAFFSKA